MASNKQFLKHFLATASTCAIFSVGSPITAMATLHETTGVGAANLNTGVNLTNGAVSSGDFLRILHNVAITANLTTDITIPAIAIGSKITAGTMTLINHNLTIGAISNNDTANTAAGPMNFTFGDAHNLTLTGNGDPTNNGGFATPIAANSATTYNQLGTVDFASNAATVIISASNATFSNQFDSSGGADGTVTINGSGNIFTGNIGNTNSLSAINVNADTTFQSPHVNVQNITIGDGQNLTLDCGASFIILTGDVNGNSDNASKLTITGVSTSGNILISGNIGTSKALSEMNLTSGISLSIYDPNGANSTYSIHSSITSTDSSYINIDSANLILFGDIGPTNKSFNQVSFNTDNTITINATGADRSIYAPIVTAAGDGTGTLATTGGNVTFTQDIGQAGGNSLKAVTFIGTDVENITFDGTNNIYSQTITHKALTLNSTANNLNITGTNYNMQYATWNTGNQTVTVAAGTDVTLTGTITIDAAFAVSEQVALDLSAATVTDTGITRLIFNVTGGAPASGDNIVMIKGMSNPITPIITGAGWTASVTPGMLTYIPPTTYTPIPNHPNNNITTDFPPANATGAEINTATTLVQNNFPTSNSTNPIDLFGVDTKTPQSIVSFEQNILNIFDTPKLRDGLEGKIGQLVTAYPDQVVPPATAIALVTAMEEDGKMSTDMANFMRTADPSSPLFQEIAKVSALGGQQQAEAMYNKIEKAAQNSINTTFETIENRGTFAYIATILTQPTITQATPIPLPSTPTNTTTPTSSTNATTPTTQIGQQADEEMEIPGDDLQAVAAGIAAGSNPYDRFGVWSSINGGFAHQKQLKGDAGFKSLSRGAAIGADTMINDITSIGFTVSNNMNYIKHKDAALGNKTDSSSWIGALYGNRQLKNNWFVRGAALFNRTRMHSNTLRITPGSVGNAKAKYNLISYGGEILVGFAHKFVNHVVATPTFGIRALHNNKMNYSEQGSTAQNIINMSQDAMNNYSALAGLSLSKTIVKYGIDFTPEAHANVQYGIDTKSPKGSFFSPLSPDQNTYFIGNKSSAVTSTYGVGLTISHDRIECGISGDMNIADKYVGYQGALKLKVKF